MLRIVIKGILGKMGQVLCSRLSRTEGFFLVGGVDSLEAYYDDEFIVSTDPAELLSDTDIVVDFSSPTGAAVIADSCRSAGIPLISGTRNLSPTHKAAILELSAHVPVFHSVNFSMGLNIMLSMIEKIPELVLSPYDADIMDIAGNRHSGSPSDSASEIQDILLSSSNSHSNVKRFLFGIVRYPTGLM